MLNKRTKNLEIDNLGDVQPVGTDWQFVRSIFDISSLCSPITKLRLQVWLAYISFCAFLITLEVFFSLSQKFNVWLDQNIFELAVIIYGVEPFMLLLHMCKARYPHSENREKVLESQNELVKNSDTAVIIPCHNTVKYIDDKYAFSEVLQSALQHFTPDNIYVVDNGSTEDSSSKLRQLIEDINATNDENINYLFYKYGNKSVALWQATRYIIEGRGAEIKYVIFIDDDVKFPANFSVDHKLIGDKNVGGIIYPLLVYNNIDSLSLLEKIQRFEYEISDLRLAAQDHFGVATAPHGACGLYKIEVAKLVLDMHTGEFNGEDLRMGRILTSMYTSFYEYFFRVDMYSHFKTRAPDSYFGHGANLWRQRVRSWEAALFEHFWPLILRPFLTDWCSTKIAAKFYQAYMLFTQFMHVFRYLLVALSYNNINFWKMFTLMTALQTSLLLMFNYSKLPSYLRNEFIPVVIYPIYLMINNFMAHMAFWRTILFTIPTRPKSISIAEKEDLPPFPSQSAKNSVDILLEPFYMTKYSESDLSIFSYSEVSSDEKVDDDAVNWFCAF